MISQNFKSLTIAARLVPLMAGAMAFAGGSLVLVGWAFDITVLKSIAHGWVSMKPNTAIGFILIGFAMLLFCSPSPFTFKIPGFICRIAHFCALLAGLIGLLSLIEYISGLDLGFDQWLFLEPAGAVGTSHPGRMAPDTAVCFILLAVGLEIIGLSHRLSRMLVVTGMLGALVTTMALVEILSYLTPFLRTAGWGGLTMMAFSTAVLFFMLGTGLMLLLWSKGSLEPVRDDNLRQKFRSPNGLGLVVTFLALASGITATGVSSFRNYERYYRAVVESQLSAIAELKTEELARWRKERLGDGHTLYNNPVFPSIVKRFFDNPEGADDRRSVHIWMKSLHSHLGYAQIALIDSRGAMRLSVPKGAAAIPYLVQDAADNLDLKHVSFLDFHRHTFDGPVHLGVMIPLFEDQDSSKPLGLLILNIDPESYLYPFIQKWPTASLSAETLLVRRNGNEVVFLNELRFQTNTALKLCVSMDRKELPAVMVAFGKTGIVQGLDYRGVPVLAALRTIPGSPWALVARQDIAEVFKPIHERLWITILLIAVLLNSAGAGIALLWRHQRVRFYREQADSAKMLQKSESLLAVAEQLGKAGGWEFDIETRLLKWSDMVYQIHELERTVQLTVEQGLLFYSQESRPIIAQAIQDAVEKGTPFDLELEIITVRGNHRQIHVIGIADIELRKVNGFCQDITERKQVESALKQSEATIRNRLKAIVEPDGDLWGLELSDIIDVEVLQSMLEDFYNLTGMLGAVLDIRGKVLVAVGWQDICTKFHRCHPITLSNCIQSDTSLTSGVPPGTFKAYRCKNNMWDMVTPLMVGGRHVGNVFIGQFFYDNEPLDRELFCKQAQRYGFDETAYLEALDRVPRFSREALESGMRFYVKLAEIISTLSFSTIQQSKMLVERKKAMEEIRQSKERFQIIFEQAPLGIGIIDSLSGKMYQVNAKYADIVGRTRKEMEAIDWMSITHPNDVQKDADHMARLNSGEIDGFQMDKRYLTPNGSVIWVNLSVARLQVEGISSRRHLAIIEDITERKLAEENILRLLAEAKASRQTLLSVVEDQKLAEEKIRKLNEELEQRVLERTTQLQGSNKELEAFSYSVSHDLRAPLRTIDGFSQALLEDYQEKPLDETGKDYLNRVSKAAQRMGILIDDMLTLSRITQAEIKKEDVDLSGMIRQIAQKYQEEDLGRFVELSIQEGVNVQGDPHLLSIAMNNLVQNAFKFTSREIHPRIEFGRSVKDGATVYFIQDNGAGFDMAYVKKLFNAFQRLHSSDEFPGTGIGLAIVQRIISRHGGHVDAAGEVEKGATFFFALP